MLSLEVMETYGWDWETFCAQPAWLLVLAQEKIIILAKRRQQEQEDLQ